MSDWSDPDQIRALKEKTEQCCVMQTLAKPPRIETEWKESAR